MTEGTVPVMIGDFFFAIWTGSHNYLANIIDSFL